MKTYRPGYAFWQHVFTMPDGRIAYGSAVDGRLLATFPAKGEWTRHAVWVDPTVAHILDGQRLARKVSDRREQVADLLESAAGPVLNNSTRGDALLPNARKYRKLSRGVGRDLRAVRRTGGNRSGAGHSRVGPERDQTLGSQCHRVLPMASAELEAAEPLLADTDRGEESDHSGPVLCRVPVSARHQVRLVHPRALRTQCRRHECGADVDQRRAPRRRGCPRPVFSRLEAGPRSARAAGEPVPRACIEATAHARISTRKWCSATPSSSGT